MDFEDIATETEATISKRAGSDKRAFMDGLECVISFLQCCLDAAEEESTDE